MAFNHEKLDVYRLAIEYVGWVFNFAERLSNVHRHARDQWLRAAQSIPLNIAEGNGKQSGPDRRRYFEIARGSATECAATQDVLAVCQGISQDENAAGKLLLDRITAMLTRMAGRGYAVKEEQVENNWGGTTAKPIFDGYGHDLGDDDLGSDNDLDGDRDGDCASASDGKLKP